MFDHETLEVFFDGKFMPFKNANVSIANTGLLYGLGVFTGMRAFKNEQGTHLNIFRPEAHYKRMLNSCKLLRYDDFKKNFSEKKFTDTIKDLLLKNSIKEDAYIRITNFSFENKITPKLSGYRENLSMFLYPLGDYVPTTGMKCCVSSWTRVKDSSIPARAKITGLYVNTALAKAEALNNGYDEALFQNHNGNIVEGSAENIFIVRDGLLITPPPSDEILEGITRQSIMEIAKDKGIDVVERSIARSELVFADEVFLTGTGAKVSPVIEIDKYLVGDGSVGPISKLMQETYLNAARGLDSNYKHWVEAVEVKNA